MHSTNMALTFEWDEEKADTILKKHQISFEEAKTVFNDPVSITIADPDHSSENKVTQRARKRLCVSLCLLRALCVPYFHFSLPSC